MVRIMIKPAVQKGMPHRRYHGRVGTVAEKRGRSYVVEVAGTKTPRIIIARPDHITPVEESSGIGQEDSPRENSDQCRGPGDLGKSQGGGTRGVPAQDRGLRAEVPEYY